MARLTKNYSEMGGDKLVIGGEIDVTNGTVTGLKLADVSDVSQADNQAASTASTVAGAVADLNALLTKLKAAGLMAADE